MRARQAQSCDLQDRVRRREEGRPLNRKRPASGGCRDQLSIGRGFGRTTIFNWRAPSSRITTMFYRLHQFGNRTPELPRRRMLGTHPTAAAPAANMQSTIAAASKTAPSTPRRALKSSGADDAIDPNQQSDPKPAKDRDQFVKALTNSPKALAPPPPPE